MSDGSGGAMLKDGHLEASGLDHPTRRRIYQHLLMLPGDHFRSIVRTLRLGHGTASHHLAVLIRSGLVSSVKVDRRCRYYPKGQDSEYARNELFMKHWSYRALRPRVLSALRRLGSAKPGMVARQLGVSRQLAAYHLARLEKLGVVRRENGRYRA